MQQSDETEEIQPILSPHSGSKLALSPRMVVQERYTITRFLAEGGMGQVYEAVDSQTEKSVALKILKPALWNDPIAKERFRREIKIAQRIRHPNVCPLLDHGEFEGQLFLVMGLLQGETLSQRIRAKGRLSPQEAWPILQQMVAALDAAHSAGIVHRDFKSGNVLLEPEANGSERAIVTDFGLSRPLEGESAASLATLTISGVLVGTPAYMAPEQVQNKPLTPAADLYALGIVLYEMLTGRLPFQGDSPLALAVLRLTEDPVPMERHVSGIPENWSAVVSQCLLRDPAARFQRATDILQALLSPSVLLPEAKPARPRFVWGVLAVAVLALLLGGAFWWFGASEPHELGAGQWTVGNLEVARLTYTPNRELEGSISPDGQWFVSVVYETQEAQYDLYLQRIEKGEIRRLTATPHEEWSPRWSPDGKKIAFVRADRDVSVWVMEVDSGHETRIAQGSWPAWGPDGKELAFVQFGDGDACLMVRQNLETGQKFNVARWIGVAESLDWSLDGSAFLWVGDGKIQMVDSRGGLVQTVPLEGSVSSAAWAPSGQALYCNLWKQGQRNIWRVTKDGRNIKALTASGEGWGLHFPSISRDGLRLIYTHEQKQIQAWLLGGDGALRMLPVKTTFPCVDIDKQGESLAFYDIQPGPGESSVGILDLQTLKVTNLGSGQCPAFSPDGRALATIRTEPGQEGLWVLDLASKKERRLGTLALQLKTPEERRPAWSPDGQWIAVITSGEASDSGLVLVNVKTSQHAWLGYGRFGHPAWSPDAQSLAVTGHSSEGAGLYLFDPLAKTGHKIASAVSYKAAPIWSADSSTLQVLVAENSKPQLLSFNRQGESVGSPWSVPFRFEPGFWGIFDLMPVHEATGSNSFVYLQERYEAELYLVSVPQPSAR